MASFTDPVAPDKSRKPSANFDVAFDTLGPLIPEGPPLFLLWLPLAKTKIALSAVVENQQAMWRDGQRIPHGCEGCHWYNSILALL